LGKQTDKHKKEWTLNKGHRLYGLSPDEQTFIVFDSKTGQIQLLDYRLEQCKSIFIGQKDSRFCVFSPDLRFLVDGGSSSKMNLWNLRTGDHHLLQNHDTRIRGYTNQFENKRFGHERLSFSDDGHWMAVLAENNKNVLWNLNSLEKIELDGHDDMGDYYFGTTHVEFSKDSKSLLTSNSDATAIVWNLDGTIQARLVGHEDRVLKACFAKDQRTIVTISDDGTCMVWQQGAK